MRKIITFLGKYPRETTYRYGDEIYSGRVFAEALRQFVDYDEILVFTTEVAAETTWPVLEELEDPRIRAVPIPTGNDEDELWHLFDCLTQEVADGDTVIFDITHGLRSIPFLVFLAAAYLKEARDVTIEKIFYGAYELGPPAPVINLSDFIALLDWMTATHRFVQLGDGQRLATLLQDRMPSGPAMRDDLQARAWGNELRHAAQAIEGVSLALGVTRPLETMETAARLEITLCEAQEAFMTHARPFALLADQVRASYAPFALTDPLLRVNWRANLRLQLAMVRWYIDKTQVVQAATLAREWIISVLAYHLGADSLTDLDEVRFPIADALNNACRSKASKPITRPSPFDESVDNLPIIEDLVTLWSRMTSLRNDIAHVGMNDHPKNASSLNQKMTRIYPLLETVAGVLLGEATDMEEPC